MSEIVLIRPGCTDFDEQHRIQGALDLPLNERGIQQVQMLAEQLRHTGLDAIYTSPSEPAKSTAEAIGRELQVPVKEVEGLRNLDQGLWQGLQIDDIRKKYPKVYKQWKESPDTICPPQGEMALDALERVRKALRKPLRRNGRRSALRTRSSASRAANTVSARTAARTSAFAACARAL